MIASEISAVWHYVFGCPYLCIDRSSQSEAVLIAWDSNRAKVDGALPSPGPRIGVGFTHSLTAYRFEAWRLVPLLHVREVYLKMNETHQFLVELHRQVLEMRPLAIRLLLLGKLAEVLEALLPGKGRPDKINQLPTEVQSRLVMRGDVFRMANDALETRHAIQKGTKALKPPMGLEDAVNFQSDLDTLARYIVSEETKIPPCYDESWRLPPGRTSAGRFKVGKNTP